MNSPTVLHLVVWIALTGFLAALGTFTDTYHFSEAAKSRVQKFLILLFVWLQELPLRLQKQANPKVRKRAQLVLFSTIGVGFLVAFLIALRGLVSEDQSNMASGEPSIGPIRIFISATVFSFAATFAMFLVLLIPSWLVRNIWVLFRRLGMEMTDAASRPSVSPLGYLGALIGLAGTIFELIKAFVSHGD